MRKLAALSALLAALVMLSGYLTWRSQRVEETLPLKGIKEGEITRLVIDRRGESIALESRGGDWRMSAPVLDAADPNPVKDVLASLLELSLGSEVSADPASYPGYELDEASAARVRVFASGAAPVLDGWFGKSALGRNSTYFRFSREAPVYLASGISAWHLSRSASEFRERRLSTLDRDAVETIAVAARGRTFELRKTSSSWTSTAAAKPEALEAAAASLLSLRAADFAAPALKADLGLDKPLLSVSLRGSARSASYAVGKAEPGKKPAFRYAKAEGRDAVMLVPLADVDAVLKALSGGK